MTFDQLTTLRVGQSTVPQLCAVPKRSEIVKR